MVISYSFIKALNGKPTLKIPGRSPKDRMRFLLKDENIKGLYLGACLDACRWGSSTSVMWEVDIEGMINFIQNWRDQNSDNYQRLFHEISIDELYERFELPYINHETCPRNSDHKGTIKDLGGRTRCANIHKKWLKEGFIDNYSAIVDALSQVERIEYFEDKPKLNIPWDEEGEYHETFKKEIEQYKINIETFDNEKRKELINEPCYAILSDKNLILPLETILRRLNLGRIPYTLKPVIFPFDGWDLAYYIQRWHEQSLNPPLFETESQRKINQRELYQLYLNTKK